MSAVDRATLAGLTLGLVDLVAVERVRAGIPAELSPEDREYLIAHLDGGNEEARRIAAALGFDKRSVQRINSRTRAKRTGAQA